MAAGSTHFALRTTLRDGLAVVGVVGELDCATVVQLRTQLSDLAEPGRVILVDLSDTEFMDCSAIHVLAMSSDRQRQLGGELVLDSPRPAVSRVLGWTQFDRTITVIHRTGACTEDRV